MTECNGQGLLFSSLGRQKIVGDFAGGRLTTDAGGLLLREVDRRVGLVEALAGCLTDPRDPAKIVHAQRTMLAQRIFGIALGYEDLNDHATLRSDPLFAVLAEQTPDAAAPLASAPTLCRLENRVDRKALGRLAAALVGQFIASYDAPPAELVLDFDATHDPLHGKQDGRFFHGFYDCYCFLPLYVFCGDRLLVSYLRPSNIDAALHSAAILKLLVTRLRQVWPAVRIIVRGDSGFCRWRLMRWCDRHDVQYVLGLARNKTLEKQVAPWMAAAQAQFEAANQKVRNFHEFEYAAQTWDRARRVIVKAEHLPQGPNVRFVVTNLIDRRPQQIYDDLYTQRGEMENRIKEQQLMLFADRTSCHAFIANQFRLLLSSAAYVLVEHLRRTALLDTELAQAQTDTIRLRLFKVAARIVTSVRRVVLHLSSAYPLHELFARILARLRTGPPRRPAPA
ncbi:Transposase DDE domain protein [Phycisphaerae bacterium RAS1]|nr:Transposase DDE domain protein [Phycisphaerae bacterium RAS1]TWT42087.1 Transposase DDE domain protein [Phycisphaerae bacterium RAS1]TWT42281.1 Transposase DDE domain protein [Phycisphaerae bacterium RAS1]TWT45534.1 Transposase DDE domain protein [Phycisphaerae bacterium RAS1]